jgi:hypothetical protein
MSEFKVGDKLISKVNDCGLTKGKQYMISKIEIVVNTTYININDDNGDRWCFHTINNDKNIAYYYADYFYTKSEFRDMKLNELGI